MTLEKMGNLRMQILHKKLMISKNIFLRKVYNAMRLLSLLFLSITALQTKFHNFKQSSNSLDFIFWQNVFVCEPRKVLRCIH